MKVWVIANQPYEDRIADYRYFEDENEAHDKALDMNLSLVKLGSSPVWKVYETDLTLIKP